VNELKMVKPDTPQTVSNIVESTSDAMPANSAGALLRAAREKAGLSLGDVASRLRMGVKQVRALEQDDYAALPTGTFLRGFVRNFAKEVGLVPDEALRLLAETHREGAAINASAVIMPSQQNIRVPTPGKEFATPRARALIAVALGSIVLAIVWYWWEYVKPHRADGGRPKVVAEEKAVSEPITLPARAVDAAPPAVGAAPGNLPDENAKPAVDLKASEPVSVPAPAVVAVAPTEPAEAPIVPRPALPAGSGLLGFTFSGESWVEVADRNGKIVLDRKFKDGETEEIVGRPPFTVVVGNAKVTKMAYNGREVDLVPHTRVAVARLTVK
jgi:cytoskeleton protein RodZ